MRLIGTIYEIEGDGARNEVVMGKRPLTSSLTEEILFTDGRK
jgi:hypothetical protein